VLTVLRIGSQTLASVPARPRVDIMYVTRLFRLFRKTLTTTRRSRGGPPGTHPSEASEGTYIRQRKEKTPSPVDYGIVRSTELSPPAFRTRSLTSDRGPTSSISYLEVMANASKKKANQAKKQAASVYKVRTLLIGSNI
jgi:hypothetical protein